MFHTAGEQFTCGHRVKRPDTLYSHLPKATASRAKIQNAYMTYYYNIITSTYDPANVRRCLTVVLVIGDSRRSKNIYQTDRRRRGGGNAPYNPGGDTPRPPLPTITKFQISVDFSDRGTFSSTGRCRVLRSHSPCTRGTMVKGV